MNQNNLTTKFQVNLLKILIIFSSLVFLVSTVSAASVSFNNLNDGDSIDLGDQLDIEWDSTQDHQSSDSLISSSISVYGPNGNEVSEYISRSSELANGESATYTISYSSNDLSALGEGQWKIDVRDTYDSEIEGEKAINISVNRQSDPELEGSFDLTNIDPSEGSSKDISGGLDISWTSENNYNSSRTLASSKLEISDSQGRSVDKTVTRSQMVSESSSTSETLSFTDSDLENLDQGQSTLTISDTWESKYDSPEETKTAEIGFSTTNSSQENYDEDFRNLNGNVTIKNVDPQSGPLNVSEGISFSWDSNNNYDGARNLESSEVRIEGSQGRTYSNDFTRDINVQAGGSDQFSAEIVSSQLDNLESGTWNFELTDYWPEVSGASADTATSNYQLNVEGSDTSSDDGDQEDNTSDDGSDVIIDDGNDGDDSTDDSTDGGDNTTEDSTDDSTDDTTDGGDNTTDDGDSSSTDCPDGFTYDSENDVCLEDSSSDSDSDDSDGSTDGDDDSDGSDGDTSDSNSDDGSSTDDQNSDGINGDNEDTNTSMLQQEVAAGISVQTMLLGLLTLLTTGLLFRRSDYTLDF